MSTIWRNTSTLGGTRAVSRQSLASLDPLYGLGKYQEEFRRSLNERKQINLQKQSKSSTGTCSDKREGGNSFPLIFLIGGGNYGRSDDW